MALTYKDVMGKTYTPEQWTQKLLDSGVSPDATYAAPGMSKDFAAAVMDQRNQATSVSPKAAQDFNDYIDRVYGGYTPSWLKDASTAAKSGKGMTDWDLNQALLTDAGGGNRTENHTAELAKQGIALPKVNRAFAAPQVADTAFAKEGLTKPTNEQYDQLYAAGSYGNRAIDSANTNLVLNGVNPGTSAYDQNLEFMSMEGVYAPDNTWDPGLPGMITLGLGGLLAGPGFATLAGAGNAVRNDSPLQGLLAVGGNLLNGANGAPINNPREPFYGLRGPHDYGVTNLPTVPVYTAPDGSKYPDQVNMPGQQGTGNRQDTPAGPDYFIPPVSWPMGTGDRSDTKQPTKKPAKPAPVVIPGGGGGGGSPSVSAPQDINYNSIGMQNFRSNYNQKPVPGPPPPMAYFNLNQNPFIYDNPFKRFS